MEALVERQAQSFIAMLSAESDHEDLDSDARCRICVERIVDAYLEPESVRLSIFIASEALVNPRVREIKLKVELRLRDYMLSLLAEDVRERGSQPNYGLLSAQIALSRAFLEAVRGMIFFMPDIERETLRKLVIERLMLMIRCDKASWSGVNVEAVLQEALQRAEAAAKPEC